MGLVGAGFVGPHHIDAVRRLGFVDVVAVAGSSEASADRKADALGARKAYGSYEALLDDPDVQVVHNATPNYLHYPVNAAAIAKGKHVVSDKPLAMTAAEAQAAARPGDEGRHRPRRHVQLSRQPARAAGARTRSRAATSARRTFSHGQYLQDWLLKDTDYSWRLEPDKGGASSALGDIGSHWCDLAQHVSGLRITHVLGDITTVIPKRKKPRGVARGVRRRRRGRARRGRSTSRSRTSRRCSLRFDNGAKGSFSVGQVCAGHKNDLVLEVCGSKASLRWRQEHQNELLDRPPRQGERDAAEGSVAARRRARAATRTCRAATRRRGRTRSAT